MIPMPPFTLCLLLVTLSTAQAQTAKITRKLCTVDEGLWTNRATPKQRNREQP